MEDKLAFGEPYEMETEHRVAIQNALRTITRFEDALVELITNCDDAYRDNLGLVEGGDIRVRLIINAKKVCESVTVSDNAGGMSQEAKRIALRYGARSASADSANARRGLHGRGLKEAIIALGVGTVRIKRNGTATETRMSVRNGRIKFEDRIGTPDASGWAIAGSGTEVLIETEPRAEARRLIDCKPQTFADRLQRHFAMRDIVGRRNVFLIVDHYDARRKAVRRDRMIRLEPYKIRGEKIETCHLQDGMVLDLFESEEPLYSKADDPYSDAGIIVCAAGIPQDLKIFDPGHPGCRYFYGRLECPALAERMQADNAFEIRTDRGGLDWRTVECQKIEREVKKVLIPHYERRAVSTAPTSNLRVTAKLENLTKEINRIASEASRLASEVPGAVAAVPGGKDRDDALEFCFSPNFAHELPGRERTFSILVPDPLVLPFTMRGVDPEVRVHIQSRDPWFRVQTGRITLKPSKSRQGFYAGTVEVAIADGAKLGAEATIIGQVGSESASAMLRVAVPGTRDQQERQSGARGLFEQIVPDLLDDPPQPVRCANKRMLIYTRFPGVKGVLLDDLSGASTPRGATILGDLVTEGLCRRLIEDEVSKGRTTDTFYGTIKRYDEIRKVALARVHDIVHQLFVKGGKRA